MWHESPNKKDSVPQKSSEKFPKAFGENISLLSPEGIYFLLRRGAIIAQILYNFSKKSKLLHRYDRKKHWGALVDESPVPEFWKMFRLPLGNVATCDSPPRSSLIRGSGRREGGRVENVSFGSGWAKRVFRWLWTVS